MVNYVSTYIVRSHALVEGRSHPQKLRFNMTIIAPEQINPLNLPSVPLDCRKALPECPGIYFAIDSAGAVQYIGRSNNIRQRWLTHHRYSQLEALGSVAVAWLQVSDSLLLPSIEAALIEYFQPLLNNQNNTKKRERTLIQFQIDPPTKEKFIQKVNQENKTITKVMLEWIKEYIGEAENGIDVVELNQQVEALRLAVKDINSRLVGETPA